MVDVKVEYRCGIFNGQLDLTHETKCFTEIIPYLLFNVFGSSYIVNITQYETNIEHPCLKIIELKNSKKRKFIRIKEINNLKIKDLFRNGTITITYKSKDKDEVIKTSKSCKFIQLAIMFYKIKHRHKKRLEIVAKDYCCDINYQYEHRITQIRLCY